MVNRHIQDQFGTPGYMEWSTIKSFDRAGNPVHCSQGELSYMGKGDRGDRDWDHWDREDRERTPRGPPTPPLPVPPPGRAFDFHRFFGCSVSRKSKNCNVIGLATQAQYCGCYTVPILS
eukprot:Skav208803  [mRNA]  locus=scaffold349:9713:10069:+ [translate_table: standard]